MARGGKRQNSGAKHKLDIFERAWIVTEFKRLERESAKLQLERAIARRFPEDIDNASANLWNLPVNLIRKEDGKSVRKIVIEAARSDASEDELADKLMKQIKDVAVYDMICDGIRAFRARQEIIAKRGSCFRLPEPYGFWDGAFEEVAQIALDRFGVRLRKDTLRNYIEEYEREFEQAIENK